MPRIGEAYYPAASKDAPEQGRCWVKMTVFPDGRIRNITLTRSSGFPRLDEACVRAFDDGRFIPATEDGKPIEKSIEIPISWILKPPEQPPSEK